MRSGRSSRPQFKPEWYHIAALLGLLLFLCGGIWHLSEKAIRQRLENRITTIKQEAANARTQLFSAQDAYDSHHLEYADHWSEGLHESLLVARSHLEIGGSIEMFVQQASESLADREYTASGNYLNQAETALSEAKHPIDRILGPPNLYDHLAQLAQRSDETVTSAELAVPATLTMLNNMKSEPWNLYYGLTFPTSYQTVAVAQIRLTEAQFANTQVVERGIVDKPLASQKADEVLALLNLAVQQAEQDERNASDAVDAMDDAQDDIDDARDYIESSNYNRQSALAKLAIAEGTLRSAENAFARQDFVEAYNLALQASDEAGDAMSAAATPTPTPEPTNTPPPTSTPDPSDEEESTQFESPIIINDDNDVGGDDPLDYFDPGSDDPIDDYDPGSDDPFE